jgi:hypothetical protein
MSHHPEGQERYYDALELKPGASPIDVRRAYTYLKDLYSKDSIAIISIHGEDLTEERRQEIIEEIDEAYVKLTGIIEQKRQDSMNDIAAAAEISGVKDEISHIEHFSGPSLRYIREKLGAEIYEIELATKVRLQHLENIEEERFDLLPEEVYIRGYLTAYARYLSLDSKQVVEEYMKRYRNWKENN